MRRGSEAVAWAKAQVTHPSQNWDGLCLKFTRSCFGDVAGGVYNAKIAYQRSKKRHTSPPPAGVPVWWSGGKNWHVALSAGNGFIYSNDIRRKGKINLVPIEEIERRWRFKYLGWTEDINGVDVWDEPKPPESRREWFITDADGRVVAYLPYANPTFLRNVYGVSSPVSGKAPYTLNVREIR